ncbi:glycosyltransferase family 90 protein [Trichoderma asperellum CBS 433.97]|uniref:Glycosyltransferase family 90 protein n=1 Tax=Trichoderma asperellum (strain ATCC 204424 / CBS 433.97 / NBRC 101777) TaxID=1042311 RepID=A0A2T3ZGB6_TRIA4|nr:glycosyltransferase family 90 protein [Trichoderma asperellum CBS 433.97]PTB43861.1 glycosyltransferase family 90 protein [Trichoderma asperellum CBS 433.97]
MWLPWTVNTELLSGYAGAALLCATLAQWLYSPGLEIYSEILCWAILPILIRCQKKPEHGSLLGPAVYGEPTAPSSPSSSQWIFAAGIAAFSFIKMETGAIQFLPILTPLLLATQRWLGSVSKLPAGPFLLFMNTICGASLISLFTIFTFSDWSIQVSLSSIILAAVLFIVYAALLPKGGTFLCLPSTNFERAIRPLSPRIVILLFYMLCLSIIFTGFARVNLIHMLLLGLLKALSWYFTAKVAQSTSWVIATTITTFSIASTSNLSNKASDAEAATWILAAAIALAQVISSLPKQAKYKSLLWIFGLISFLPFLLNLWMIRDLQQSSKVYGPEQEHPVEALVRNSNIYFKNLLQKQSKNYQQAVTEYQHRYGVKPPPGFEAWYEFAISRQSPIIDDFDGIYQAILPLWNLSGQQVLEIMNQVYSFPKSEMWFCMYYGAYAQTRCMHSDRIYDRHIEYQFDRLLLGFNGVLPDIRFLFNHFDEPRILMPTWEVGKADSYPSFNVRNMSQQPIWDEITKFCASTKKLNIAEEIKIPTEVFDMSFVTNRSSAIDLCEHPEYRNMHGLFMSPVTFSLVEGLVPALSTGSPSTMGDILFPSPAYIEEEFTYDDTREISWEEKKNNLYWAGSTTGAFASSADWPRYHRQRFVKLVQNAERQQHYYLRQIGGIMQRVASSFLNGRLFDVSFTRIFQCDRKYCRDQAKTFKIGRWADKDKALQSRLVFDLDGNGISGRYYKLLASKSAPLKQTLLREWHDDRLVPWVHYIPVSQSLQELPELVFYLTSTESGQQRAREIAERGRDWFFKALREADMSVYTYRLLLELARLQDPNRPAGLPAAE